MTLESMIDYWDAVSKCDRITDCDGDCNECQFEHPDTNTDFELSGELVDYLKELKNLRNTIKLLTRIKGE